MFIFLKAFNINSVLFVHGDVMVFYMLGCFLQRINKKAFAAKSSVAEFIVPDWGDEVNSGIGLSYRPARLHRLTAGTTCRN
jgi:hypothetical protein